MAARARANADWVCNTCGTSGAGGPETAGWQLTCPHCDAIDSLVWRAGSAGQRGDGGFLLEQASDAAPATAFLAAGTLPPLPPMAAHAATSVAPPAGPIPHGSSEVQPVPSPATARESAEPAPIGASVDAARRVN
jgi:hypothetical protein